MVRGIFERLLVHSRVLSALALATGFVLCGLVVRDMIIRIKGDRRDYSLEVSGAARRTARADSADWEGDVIIKVDRVSDGQVALEGVRNKLKALLVKHGVTERNIRYAPVDVAEVRRQEGQFNTKVVGYVLTQPFHVRDNDGDKLERLATQSGEVIDSLGIAGGEYQWKPGAVSYVYEHLDGAKQQVMASAVQNAKTRASVIADAAGVKLATLRQIELGDVQVRSPGSSKRYSDDECTPTKDIIADVKLLYLVR